MVVLNKFIEAYSNRDMEDSISFFAPDDDVIVFGIEPDEKRIGLNGIKEQLIRDWTHTDSSIIEINWCSISSIGSVAWVAAEAFIRVKVNSSNILKNRNFYLD